MNINKKFNEGIKSIMKLFGFEEKSEMESWAEKEIEIACKRERADSNNPEEMEWDYGCACYESALKAFKSLMGDGHSGYSIGLTKNILDRLIDGKPLSPIEDTPDIWNNISEYRSEEGYNDYQCSRMSSLFKYVYDDGTTKYKDVNSFYCINIDNGLTYHSGLVQKIMDEMFPITMPYSPRGPIKVYCSELLTDAKNGDFDTVAVVYAIKPDGSRVEINRFFKEAPGKWIEIELAEYNERKNLAKLLGPGAELNNDMPAFISKEFHTPDASDAPGNVSSEIGCEGASND